MNFITKENNDIKNQLSEVKNMIGSKKGKLDFAWDFYEPAFWPRD